jgi:hypothetical protein
MAHPALKRRHGQGAQVLVFFALALPLVLLPVAAYAVDASVAATAFSRLVEVSARAAEDAAEQIDLARLRAGGGISIDVVTAASTAQAVLQSADPPARLVDLAVLGEELRLVTSETVVLPFSLFGDPDDQLRAAITARIAPGYDSPSSRFPLPVSTF